LTRQLRTRTDNPSIVQKRVSFSNYFIKSTVWNMTVLFFIFVTDCKFVRLRVIACISSGDPAQSSGAAEGGTQSSEAGFSDTATGGEASNQQTSDATGGAESAEGKKSEKNSKYAEMRRAQSAEGKSSEINSKYAAMRRAQEQKAANATADTAAERAQALQKERLDTIIAVTGGENPYTHEPIKDWTDAQEYLTMRRIEQGGGDPLQDYAKTIKREARERAEQERAAEQQRQWYIKDRADFAAAYPDVKPDDLIHDADFSTYAQGKVGKVPLTEIYRGYRGMVDKIAANVEQRLTRTMAQAQANRQASPGTLSGSGEGEVFFTREAVQKMSQDEVRRNYDKIVQDMKHWK
jgi:hypothetical protein